MEKNLRVYFKKVFSRFGQFLYLTLSNFTKNALWESAGACAFGFIFSFIPVTLIIFAVLTGILRLYPNIYNFVITFTSEIDSVVNIQPILDRMMGSRSITGFNIFLGVWIVWMARKLFNSIILSMNRVFKSVTKRKGWFNQVLTLITEFTMTLIVAIVVIAAFVFSQILELPFFQTLFERFPKVFSPSSQNIGSFVLYFILFVSTTIAYRVIPGTKPLTRRCFFYAALNTVAFFIVSFFINMFMNVSNYNTVYGTISSLVVLMMKVYIFFTMFLFCAQMIYVSQFFETLLRSEVYLLPDYESKGLQNYLRRLLFKNPSQIQTKENTVRLQPGDTLYTADEAVDYVYFIKKGRIAEKTNGYSWSRTQGSFLGDVQCILNESYRSDATAMTDCELIRFPRQDFMQIIDKSHSAARKAISKISEYTASTSLPGQETS